MRNEKLGIRNGKILFESTAGGQHDQIANNNLISHSSFLIPNFSPSFLIPNFLQE